MQTNRIALTEIQFNPIWTKLSSVSNRKKTVIYPYHFLFVWRVYWPWWHTREQQMAHDADAIHLSNIFQFIGWMWHNLLENILFCLSTMLQHRLWFYFDSMLYWKFRIINCSFFKLKISNININWLWWNIHQHQLQYYCNVWRCWFTHKILDFILKIFELKIRLATRTKIYKCDGEKIKSNSTTGNKSWNWIFCCCCDRFKSINSMHNPRIIIFFLYYKCNITIEHMRS